MSCSTVVFQHPSGRPFSLSGQFSAAFGWWPCGQAAWLPATVVAGQTATGCCAAGAGVGDAAEAAANAGVPPPDDDDDDDAMAPWKALACWGPPGAAGSGRPEWTGLVSPI